MIYAVCCKNIRVLKLHRLYCFLYFTRSVFIPLNPFHFNPGEFDCMSHQRHYQSDALYSLWWLQFDAMCSSGRVACSDPRYHQGSLDA